jgi:hypothetical protein
MIRFARPFLIAFCLLTLSGAASAQTGASAQSNDAKKVGAVKDAASANKTAKDAEAARILKERRAQAQSLLISLAADVANYNDQTLRARTQARIADALWDVDAERGRTLFRKAWEAAEVADKEGQQRLDEEIQQQRSRNGGSVAVSGPPNLRSEVLRLAARRDRALGEELLDKLKTEKQREVTEAADKERSKIEPLTTPEALSQRLNLARQLLDTDVERALQFADLALGTVTRDGLEFLSYLRDKDPGAADQRYAAMLRVAAGNLQSDANTVSLLSSYLFTPHLFVTFSEGGASTTQSSATSVPPTVSPELRTAFFRVASDILLRPLATGGQDQTTSGTQGKYLVIKRLLPLFEQYSTSEATAALRAQMQALAAAVPEGARDRDDSSLREGIRPPQTSEEREQALQDRIDRAKTSAERDRLYLLLSRVVAERGDLRARDLVDKIEDSELRKKARAYLDVTMTMRFVDKKETDRVLEMIKIGDLSHLHRVWALTQASKLMAKTDAEKSLALLDDAATEARRLDVSDPDRPKALMAVANGLFAADRARGWEASLEAVKAANSAESFTGEDGVLRISLLTANMSSVRSSSVQDFDVAGIFTALAKEDYGRSVELARGFEREAPRASAVIAIARSVLSEKQK